MVSSCNRVKSFPTAALSTSGIRVEGDSFLSACQNKLPCVFSCKIKTGDNPCGVPPVKNPCVMTSYGGIIRIRLKGRSLVTSSQPASQAPLYLFIMLLYTRFSKIQEGTGKISKMFVCRESRFWRKWQTNKKQSRKRRIWCLLGTAFAVLLSYRNSKM